MLMKKIVHTVSISLLSGIMLLSMVGCQSKDNQRDVNVNQEISNILSLDKTEISLSMLGETAVLKASEDVEWSVDKPEVAKVIDGVVIAMGDGVAIIRATNGEKEASCTVTVNSEFSVNIEGENVINLKSSEGSNKIKLNANVIMPTVFDSIDGIEWTSNNEEIATVDDNGNVIALKQGIVKINATSFLEKTTVSSSMMGETVETSPATSSVIIIVDNEYTKDSYPELVGEYSGYKDWLGFATKNSEESPSWTADNLKWIRANASLSINDDGTYVQIITSAQRDGYMIDSSKPDGDTYEIQTAKYGTKSYVYNNVEQISSDFETKDGIEYHDLPEFSVGNLKEKGVFAVFNGELVFYFESASGEVNYVIGSATNNEWVDNEYTPISNIVKFGPDMIFTLTK